MSKIPAAMTKMPAATTRAPAGLPQNRTSGDDDLGGDSGTMNETTVLSSMSWLTSVELAGSSLHAPFTKAPTWPASPHGTPPRSSMSRTVSAASSTRGEQPAVVQTRTRSLRALSSLWAPQHSVGRLLARSAEAARGREH